MSAASQGVIRRLPGRAQRNRLDQIEFRKGYVIFASPRVQYVETDAKAHRLVYLIGDTFIYWCFKCQCTVWEKEVTQQGGRHCPFCRGPIFIISEGEKVRLHYRYAHDSTWASWWAEKWDW